MDAEGHGGRLAQNRLVDVAHLRLQRVRATIDRRECELCAGRLALVDRLAVEAHEDLVAGLERRGGLHGDGERIEVHELLLVGRPTAHPGWGPPVRCAAGGGTLPAEGATPSEECGKVCASFTCSFSALG